MFNQEEQSSKSQVKRSVQFDYAKVGKERTIIWSKEFRLQGLRDKKKLGKLSKHKNDTKKSCLGSLNPRAVREDIRELTFVEELIYVSPHTYTILRIPKIP